VLSTQQVREKLAMVTCVVSLCKKLNISGDRSFSSTWYLEAPQAVASKLSYQSAIPSVISFHGQLLGGAVGYGINQQALKKRLYLNLVGRKVVQRSKVLHAITKCEAESLRAMFPHSPIEVIPNFVDTQLIDGQINSVDIETAKHSKEILYLGRLDVRKGVVQLLHAFAQAKLPAEWTLCIAGPDDTPGLREELKKLAYAYQMDKRIRVHEPVFGKEKWELLCNASFVCSPSFHEVIGMVNLEAALCSKVVLTTPYTGLEGWEEAGGVFVEPSIEEISTALLEIASWSDSELVDRGASLKAWVSNYYSLDRVRTQWLELYGEAMG